MGAAFCIENVLNAWSTPVVGGDMLLRMPMRSEMVHGLRGDLLQRSEGAE